MADNLYQKICTTKGQKDTSLKTEVAVFCLNNWL